MTCFLKSNRAMQEMIATPNHDLIFWKVKLRQTISKPNHSKSCLFFGKSNRATRKIITKPDHDFFLGKSN
jgi:hypothetical protein